MRPNWMKNVFIKLVLLIAICTVLFFGFKLIGSLYFLQKSREITQGVSLFDIDYRTLDVENVKEAENFIQKSKKLFQFKQSDLELARIQYLEDNYEESYSIFVNNILPDSNNPLDFLETGIVMAEFCENLDLTELECYDKNPFLVETIKEKAENIDFSTVAKYYFQQENFYLTEEILLLSQKIFNNVLSVHDSNLLFISKVVNHSGKIKIQSEKISNFYDLNDNVLIQIEHMNWINGNKIDSRSIDINNHYGILWFSDYVFSKINVEESGNYLIRVKAMDNPPSPIIFELAFNLEKVMEVNLDRGDYEWFEYEQEIFLQRGINILTIRLVNDYKADGLDRNGIIDWVYLEKLQE